ncbi:SH3 domain-containing protein [Azospirillum brasilense]|uniref:SH3 domain-containing protein n=1 Tax=Azospirillum brasilense TaxID=192 RepID=UPI0010C0C852|nr:SH3 domain-containing protein [Azospirillum brasilense]
MLRWPRSAVWTVALVLVTANTAFAPQAFADDKRVALVIGNAQYEEGGPAAGVGANAAVVADALRRAGFTVTAAENLDHRGMVAALSRFQDALGQAELGFLYYSGVALSLSAKGFLVPVDAKPGSEYDVIFDTVELDYALKEIQRSGRKAVAVFDPVPAHPLADRLASAMGEEGRSVKPALAAPAALDNLFVVYSHRPGTPPATAAGKGADAFSTALAQEMVKPGVPLRDALAEVARSVVGRTRGTQHPWLQDRLGTDLVLVPGPRAPVVARTEEAPPAVAAAPEAKPAEPKPIEPRPIEPKPLPQKAEEKPAAPAVAEVEVDPLNEKRVVTRDTNLRAGPDTKAAVVGTLRHDSEVMVTGRTRRNGGWLRVEQDGKTGFAFASNLAKPEEVPVASAQPPTQLQQTQQPPQSQAAALTPGVYTVARDANLFARPVLGARSLRDLEQGQRVTLLQAAPDSGWVLVRDSSGQEGYVTTGTLAGRSGEAVSMGGAAGGAAPSAYPPPTVVRNDVDPVAGALSGTTGPTRLAALPQSGGPEGGGESMAGRSTTGTDPALAGLAEPYRDAVQAGRNAAARASRSATAGRGAEAKAREAQAAARRAAGQARGGESGYGVHRFPNGDVYEGAWNRGLGNFSLQGTISRNGVGVYRFANGQVYEGEWKDDQMSGYGVLGFPSGDRFEGTFVNAVPNGPGVYRFANGDSYAGEVRQGRVDGHGELAFTNGERFNGVVVDRLPAGPGELSMRGGTRHVGQFRGGIQDGPGAAIDAAGAMQPGIWRGATLLSR